MKKNFSICATPVLSTAFVMLLFWGICEGRAATLEVPTQYSTIQQAIDAAHAGDTVLVKPGSYTEALFFKNGIKLVGTDKKTCRITAMYGEPAILIAMCCSSGTIENLCFDGTVPPNLKNEGMYILGLAAEMKDGNCVVTKVMANSPASKAGIRPGTIVYKCQKGNIEFTKDIDHYLDPYLAAGKDDAITLDIGQGSGRKQVKLRPEKLNPEQSLIEEWRKRPILADPWPHGVVLIYSSGITVKNCIVKLTRGTGIAVAGRGKCIIQSNECLDNGCNGICLSAGTTSLVKGNLCQGSGALYPGIVATSDGSETRTVVEIRNNQCLKNFSSGIYFTDGASGVAEGNVCNQNSREGISVANISDERAFKKDKETKAIVEIRNNQCLKNGTSGIEVFGSIGGITVEAEGNTCNQNFEKGIYINNLDEIQEVTIAILKKNTCSDNGEGGIYFSSKTGGVAEENICLRNKHFGGIYVGHAEVVLKENKCLGNEPCEIYY